MEHCVVLVVFVNVHYDLNALESCFYGAAVCIVCVCVYVFLLQKFMIGLNFADEQEAERFGNAVETKIHERVEKKRANSMFNSMILSLSLLSLLTSHHFLSPSLSLSLSHFVYSYKARRRGRSRRWRWRRRRRRPSC